MSATQTIMQHLHMRQSSSLINDELSLMHGRHTSLKLKFGFDSNRQVNCGSHKFKESNAKSNNSDERTSNIFSAIPRKHKIQKPISRGFYESARLCRVYELDMTDSCIRNIPRSGVLFYTFIDGELFICFGRDNGSGDLTDFGGGRRQSEDPIKCAIREGNEESRFAFSEIQTEQVQGFFCLYSSNMLIVFIPVAAPDKMDIRTITKENFLSKQFLTGYQSQARCYNEVSDLVWLGESSIENLFSPRPNFQMFAKVRRFIYSCSSFSKNLNRMKCILMTIIEEAKQFENLVDNNTEKEQCSTEDDQIPIVSYPEFTENIDSITNTNCRNIYGSSLRRSTCSPGIIRVDSYVTDDN